MFQERISVSVAQMFPRQICVLYGIHDDNSITFISLGNKQALVLLKVSEGFSEALGQIGNGAPGLKIAKFLLDTVAHVVLYSVRDGG